MSGLYARLPRVEGTLSSSVGAARAQRVCQDIGEPLLWEELHLDHRQYGLRGVTPMLQRLRALNHQERTPGMWTRRLRIDDPSGHARAGLSSGVESDAAALLAFMPNLVEFASSVPHMGLRVSDTCAFASRTASTLTRLDILISVSGTLGRDVYHMIAGAGFTSLRSLRLELYLSNTTADNADGTGPPSMDSYAPLQLPQLTCLGWDDRTGHSTMALLAKADLPSLNRFTLAGHCWRHVDQDKLYLQDFLDKHQQQLQTVEFRVHQIVVDAVLHLPRIAPRIALRGPSSIRSVPCLPLTVCDVDVEGDPKGPGLWQLLWTIVELDHAASILQRVHLTFCWPHYTSIALPFRWAVLQSSDVDTSSSTGCGGLEPKRVYVEAHGKAFALAHQFRLRGIELLDEDGKSAPRLASS
jgi:hypothetical protein